MPPLKFSAGLAAGDPAGLASFEVHAGLLAKVYPQWHFVDSSGLPLCRPEVESGLRQKVRGLARRRGVELWPQVALHPAFSSASEEDLARLLGDEVFRVAHAAALVRLAREDGAQGLSLDYGKLHGAGRGVFARLAEHLALAFRHAGLKLGLVVPAHYGPREPEGDPEAPDYAALASACDLLQLKGFACVGGDGEGFDGVPGPIAAPEECGEVLGRFTALLPAEKIEWGLPASGQDWGPERFPLEIPYSRWESLVKTHPPERRDPSSGELMLTYEGRSVWMNDAISLTGKLWQVRRHGVGQTALWNLGAEDPRLWALLDSLPQDFF